MVTDQGVRSGTRFRLLLYLRLFDMMRWPALLLVMFSYLLWVNATNIPLFAQREWLLWLLIGPAALLALFTIIGPHLAYVQCRRHYLLVSTPLYRVAISYRRIRAARPVNFAESYSLKQQSWSQRRFLHPLFCRAQANQLTAINVELTDFPLPQNWLRFWLNRYMFAGEGVGLLFMVRDWMLLNRQIQIHREGHRT